MQEEHSVPEPALSSHLSGRDLVRTYPVACFAAIGIVLGLVLMPYNGTAAHIVFRVVLTGGGLPLFWATLRNMAQGRFHVDTIAALAIVGSALLGQYLAGALVVLMQSGGEALEDYGLRRANRSLDNLLRRAPSVAHRKSGETFEDIPVTEVAVGDTLLIRPGDILPVDGVVTEGWGRWMKRRLAENLSSPLLVRLSSRRRSRSSPPSIVLHPSIFWSRAARRSSRQVQ